jgi:hypothetical protein
MSLSVSDLNLPADKLSQMATALGDTGGANAALQGICNGAAADVARLTAGYVIDATSQTNFGRAIALFRAYGQVGPIPPDVEKNYDAAWNELTDIAQGKRPNLPKVADPNQASIAGRWGGGHRLPGRTSHCE